ncbi:MAG: hypothetical protein R2741_12120 [Methanolobus sp.]
MCGECSEMNGLHVPEDLVHLDVYDPQMDKFVKDGECGRVVLSTLLPVGAKSGNVLLNYDTEDTTVVVSREECACGRTHMKILNPRKEARLSGYQEPRLTGLILKKEFSRGENMEYLTGEYEAFLYGGDDEEETTLRVSMECNDLHNCEKEVVKENFLKSFNCLQEKP